MLYLSLIETVVIFSILILKARLEDYFKKVCPAIYNYVIHNFDTHMFCGVSAQGAKYGQNGLNLNTLTETGKRAYVFTTEKIYDLSLPLDFLISE